MSTLPLRLLWLASLGIACWLWPFGILERTAILAAGLALCWREQPGAAEATLATLALLFLVL